MKTYSPVGTDLSSMFDNLEEVAGRVRTRVEAESEMPESHVEGAGPREQLDSVTREIRATVLTDGARGLEKVARDPEADLTPDEQIGVEAIVVVEGRPALFVEGGDFTADLPEEWSVLGGARAAVRESLARVGRIEVEGHPDLDWVGTAFLVAPDTVMTNRHVAREFSRRDGDTWTFMRGRSAGWDILEERGRPDQMQFTVTELIGVHDADDVDLALLRVESPDGGPSLPAPLQLAGTAPGDVVGRRVYVVGYPAWDGRRNEPDDMRRIFADIYNVKRLQPGTVTVSGDPDKLLRHDCSTLGGNSGSPVIDLETHQVLGLHFGGRYRVGNHAVPMWRLADDDLVRPAQLNFV
jgi:flavodoxin